MRSTPKFDVVLQLPESTGLTDEQRKRIEKENSELEKVITNSRRQLDNSEIIAKMPEKVVNGMRTKLAGYEAQLAKNKAALNQ